MRDEELKESVINYVKENGIKYTFICNKLRIHTSSLSRFLNSDGYLSTKVKEKLQNYITKTRN